MPIDTLAPSYRRGRARVKELLQESRRASDSLSRPTGEGRGEGSDLRASAPLRETTPVPHLRPSATSADTLRPWTRPYRILYLGQYPILLHGALDPRRVYSIDPSGPGTLFPTEEDAMTAADHYGCKPYSIAPYLPPQFTPNH